MGSIKKKLFAAALAVTLLTGVSQGSLAYFSTAGKATNVVTSGNLRLRVHETTDQGAAFPETGVQVMPGDVVRKEVRVENDCAHPFYLRVKLVYGADSRELSPEDCLRLDINEEYWELRDGWYYYKGIVNPRETTPNVFSRVEIIGSQVDNRYLGKALTLTVKAQAVQSENNPIADGKPYTASGWPAE